MRQLKWVQILLAICYGLCFAPNIFAADSQYNMTPGVTPTSRQIYDLHMTIFGICVVIGIIVFSVLIYALVMHRKSRGAVAATFHENTAIEVMWAIIPLIILIAMAIPATKVLMSMSDYSDSALTIKIVGYQWKWKYEYLNQGISFYSNLSTPMAQIQGTEPKGLHYLREVDKPLVVPVGKKIRFLMTSNDVIHSWWVPALGVKKDAMPGLIHESWALIEKPGIYRGQCAELCGVNHGFMPIVVEAVPEKEFEQWVAQQQEAAKPPAPIVAAGDAGVPNSVTPAKTYTLPEMMDLGKQVYNRNCQACHQENGRGMPPTFPPLRGSSIAVGPVPRHIERVLNGVPGSAMQAFGPQLNDLDLAAVITYERNAWDNNTGQVVQPSDIQKARLGQK